VPHSTVLHSVLHGGTYLTGPLARYSLGSALLPADVTAAARAAGLGTTCTNPFRSIVVRAVELAYACGEALRLIRDYEPPAAEVTPDGAATGYGCTEAPRRILYHRYAVSPDGTVTDAKIVPPTSQNQRAIEADLRGVRRRPARLASGPADRRVRAVGALLRPVYLLCGALSRPASDD